MSVNRNVTTPRGELGCHGLGPPSAVRADHVRWSAVASRSRATRTRSTARATPGCSRRTRSAVPGGERKAGRGLVRDDLGVARTTVEHRELAEEVARTEARQEHPVAHDAHAALGDDEQPGADLALAGDDAPGRELDLDDCIADDASGPRHRGPRTAGRRRSAPLDGSRRRVIGSSGAGRAAMVRRGPARQRPGIGRDHAAARDCADHSRLPPVAMAGETGGSAVATREELADILPGSRCSGTCGRPQLLGVAGCSRRRSSAEGERILRQGLTGSGFYVILDGSAEVCIDGTSSEHAAPGRLLRRGLDPARRAADRRRRRHSTPCAAWSSPAVRRSQPFLLAQSAVMFRMLQAQARRLRNANRWRS